MECPVCGGKLGILKGSEGRRGGIITRKRECRDCLTVFTTNEKIRYDYINSYILDKMHERAEKKRRKSKR